MFTFRFKGFDKSYIQMKQELIIYGIGCLFVTI